MRWYPPGGGRSCVLDAADMAVKMETRIRVIHFVGYFKQSYFVELTTETCFFFCFSSELNVLEVVRTPFM